MEKQRYKALFFDLDDTVIDTTYSVNLLLRQTLREFGIEPEDKIIHDIRAIGAELWEEFRRGEIDRPALHRLRFVRLFDKYKFEAPCDALSEAYLARINDAHVKIAGADNTCAKLFKKYDLYIASNGELEIQKHKLKRAGLMQYFKDLYISDEIGYLKPDHRFFETMLARAGCEPESALMIGDSIKADIEGAAAAGMDTCLIDYHKADRSSLEGAPTFIIDTLPELLDILL